MTYWIVDIGTHEVNAALSVAGEPSVETVTVVVHPAHQTISCVIVRKAPSTCPRRPVERLMKFSRSVHSPALASCIQLA